MKASIIVPAHNSEDTIGKTLKSLLRQGDIDFEIIVVDDGSTDNTREMASKYPVKMITQQNRGPAAARNNGTKNANGEILVFTDADCVVEDGWLQEMLRPFSDPEIVGVQGRYKTKQRELIARFAQYEIEERYERMARYEYLDFIGSYSAAYRRDIFLRDGGFDESFPVASGEDPELSFRLAEKGHKMVFNPNAIVYHQHPDALLKYLHQKFYRAYWRVALYVKNPMKIKRESYTPQMLKLQVLLFYLLIVSFIFGVTKIAIAGFFITTLPLAIKMLRRDISVGLVAPFIILMRAAVFSAGLLKGAVDYLFKHMR